MKKIIALVLALMTIFSLFPVGASAASRKPAASGISASYDKSIYNDEALVINVKLSSSSLCDTVTVTIGDETVSVKPTTRTRPIRQTAKLTFDAFSFDPGTYDITITAKSSSGSTSKRIGSVEVMNTYSVKNKRLTIKGVKITEFKVGGKYTDSRYVWIDGKKVDLAAWQCYGWARFLQEKLYGANSGIDRSKFTKLTGSINTKPSAAKFEELCKKAGVGAHIRTKSGHSLVIIAISENGITITDANADLKNTIRVKTYTYKQFLKAWGKLAFIEVYTG